MASVYANYYPKTTLDSSGWPTRKSDGIDAVVVVVEHAGKAA